MTHVSPGDEKVADADAPGMCAALLLVFAAPFCLVQGSESWGLVQGSNHGEVENKNTHNTQINLKK